MTEDPRHNTGWLQAIWARIRGMHTPHMLECDANGNLYTVSGAGAGALGYVGLVDESGVAYGVPNVSGKPRISSMPYLYDIAEGNVADHTALRRFGRNPVVAASLETVYNVSDLRTYLTAAERLQVTSDDADDDGAPVGDGARTLTITGLDGNYAPLSETITMNGVANVLTDASYLRIFNSTVATAGDTGYNEGTITVSNNADAIVLDQIDPQTNQSHSACYTVPAGFTAYITQAMATEASNKGSTFGFWVRVFGGLWVQQRAIVLLESTIVLPMTLPMKLPEKTDIEIRAEGVLAGAVVTAGFEGWIEANA